MFDTTKSRMHRHLQTLVAAGYVMREEETERYRSGARLIAFGRAVAENFELTSAARPVMEALRSSLGHAVTLSQPEPDGMRVNATHRGKVRIRTGREARLDAGAARDRAGQADARLWGRGRDGPRTRQAVAAQHAGDHRPTPALRGEIEQVRRQGWAVAPNQAVIGLNALGAPIFDALGTLVGAIAIVDSVQFIPADPAAKQVRETVAAAKKISTTIGARGN